MRRGTVDNSKKISHFSMKIFNENMCCDHSLEPSRRDGANDGHKICFYRDMWLIILKLSLLPILIWSTALRWKQKSSRKIQK